MKTVIIGYEKISPAVLESIILKAYPMCLCNWHEIDEDYFEFTVYYCPDLAMLEDLLAMYV